MKVADLIAELSKRDPNAPAAAAVKEISRKPPLALDVAGIKAEHDRLMSHASTYVDKKGNTNAPEDLELVAYNGVRSMVHDQLQALHPGPQPHPNDEEDGDEEVAKEIHHLRQKAHGKRLWRRTDELVAQAGIVAPAPKGEVS